MQSAESFTRQGVDDMSIKGLSRRERKDLANELDSVLTEFEELTAQEVVSVKEEILYDARYVAEFIGQLQEILRVLDKEEELIR